MKRFIYLILATVITLSLIIPAMNVSAKSIEQYDKKIKQLEEEKGSLANKKNKVNEKKSSVSKEKGTNKKEQLSVERQMEVITKEVDKTEGKIKVKSDEIKDTNKEIKKLKKEIKQLNEEIETLKQRIKEREEMLSSRLQSIQEAGGDVQFIEVILGAKSFSDLITRSSAINTVMDSDKTIMEEHASDKKALETKEKQVQENKASLENKKASQIKEKEKLDKLKGKLKKQKKKQSKIKAKLVEEYKDLEYAELTLEEEESIIDGETFALVEAIQSAQGAKGKLKAAERQRIADEQAAKVAKAAKEAEARKAAERKQAQEKKENKSKATSAQPKAAPSKSTPSQSIPKAPKETNLVATSSGGGSFGKPTSGGVTSEYNPSRVHPISGVVRPHNGIDIGAGTGTSVNASASGVVSTAGSMGGYGNTVMITHFIDGKSYTTLYAHLSSISVSNGQKVSRGQNVGSVGSTGASTGPHLHFEIHAGGFGNPVNPRNHVGF